MTNINNLEPHNTVPKPFVFVLIPFDPSFDDIYKFGIKGAAEDVGAYAERVDEQIFLEGILDRRGDGVKSLRAVAQTHRLAFDRLRPNGGVLKSYDFSVHAELVEA